MRFLIHILLLMTTAVCPPPIQLLIEPKGKAPERAKDQHKPIDHQKERETKPEHLAAFIEAHRHDGRDATSTELLITVAVRRSNTAHSIPNVVSTSGQSTARRDLL